MAWHKLTGQRVAVKTYEKAKIKVSSDGSEYNPLLVDWRLTGGQESV